MSYTKPENWHWCVTCHDDLWKLGLAQHEVLAFVYFSSFCLNKGFPISILKMSKALHMDTKRCKRAIDILIERQMLRKTTHFGRASTFMVIPRTSKTWGQTPLGIGSNAPTPLGANDPTTWGQTPLLTTNLDTEFLSIFDAHIRKWTFNRMPIGRRFIFTRGMQIKGLQMMRYLHQKWGFGSPEAFHKFLDGIAEYLSLDRDVLSPSRDQRALSPAKWLNDWPEQIRLAGIYMDEKEQKITRIELGEKPL